MQWSKITDATDDTNQVDGPNLQQTRAGEQEGAAAKRHSATTSPYNGETSRSKIEHLRHTEQKPTRK